MPPSFSMDDLVSLRTKIDSKAANLFKEKKGKAPLQVSRVFRSKIGEDKDTPCFVRDQNVWDKSQIEALKNVRLREPKITHRMLSVPTIPDQLI
jgi:hypothetical protein